VLGAAVVVWRRGSAGREFLVLHRRVHDVDEGDWVWTPPSGMRTAGESAADNAARELREETGLELVLTQVVDAPWAVFTAEAPRDAEVILDDEHDRYEWLPLEGACARCLPVQVADGIRRAAAS
jgi:ADP-ribose pyrophosphatase YjhB (NUDIX family)